MNLADKVRESNRIEGIYRAPTNEEVEEHRRFTNLEVLRISDLIKFVGIYQPGARIRNVQGRDVRVGNYYPPQGGEKILHLLDNLILECNADTISPWQAHVKYEMLHPFEDGNGRSGRALWYWMMVGNPMADLGFLHAFYYQTLMNEQTR